MLALRTILVADAALLLAVAGLLFGFMEHPAGVIGAAACCLLAGVCLGAARWLDRLYDRSR
jgi:hypothetical protein